MKSDTYFIPINSNSLAHYFSRAIILPAKYFSNKVNDIQDKFKDSILLSNKKWVDNTDCSIEVILTEDETRSLRQVSESFFCYYSPIPISRVKMIYFLDKEQSRTTAWNINNGAAFIPEFLIKIDSKTETQFISESEINNYSATEESTDFSKKVKYFDHLLGGLAFMRLGGESYMNYSENYFPTLSYFNNLIKDQYKKVETEKRLKFNDKYSGVFAKNEGPWGKWQSYFYQNIELEDVENLASQEGVNIDKKFGVLQLDKIIKNSIIYDLALLATYGNRKNKSIDNFVSDLTNGNIPNEKKEEVALLMGLNNGYSRLRNRYKLPGVDKSVKFELNSKLDYYTIESIYQYAFNGKRDNYNFPYIDEWVAQVEEKKALKGNYMIMDKIVIAKKKPQPFSQEYLEDILQNNSPKEIYSTIVKAISQWLPPYIQNKQEEGEKHFEEVLKKPIISWWKNFINILKHDYEINLQEQKDELLQNFEDEKKQLNGKIQSLSEEINQLKSKVNQTQTESFKEASPVQTVEIEKAYPEHEQISSVAEDNNDEKDDYSLKDLKELKKIAKEKGIKPLPTKKDDLIKAIKALKPSSNLFAND